MGYFNKSIMSVERILHVWCAYFIWRRRTDRTM